VLLELDLSADQDRARLELFAFQQTINSTIPFLMITWAQQGRRAGPTLEE
jgi:hypothetical protein